MVLREPTVGEVLKAEQVFAVQEGGQARRVRNRTLITLVSGVSEDLVRKMPVSKFREAAEYLNAFDAPADRKAPRNTDAELVIPLGRKIEKMGRIVDQLELREPTTGEVEEAQRKLTANTSEQCGRCRSTLSHWSRICRARSLRSCRSASSIRAPVI